MSTAILLIIVTGASALICHYIAKKRNAKPNLWVGLALCIGPFAIPFAFFAKP